MRNSFILRALWDFLHASNFNAIPGPRKLFTYIYCSVNLAVRCIASLNL